MHKEDKIGLIVGASLIVIGITGMVVSDRLIKKAAKKSSEEFRQRRMQEVWEDIQNSAMFEKLTPESRIAVFDTYWKTTGGVK